MQRTMKFLHTMGAIGMMGSMAALLALYAYLPEPAVLAEYARMRAAMEGIATWIFLPSLGATLVSGLFAIALSKAFRNSGWVIAKLIAGIIVFEWSLIGIHGPMKREANLSADVLAGNGDIASLGSWLTSEWQSLIVMLALATANVVLGVWRPRFGPK